jgi:cytochrome c oxidase cbb3-type subunit 3
MIQTVARWLSCLACAAGAALLLAGCGGGGNESESLSPEQAAELDALSNAYTNDGVAALRRNPNALALGKQLYAAHCASCHGADGKGSKGITDLTLGHFAWGATEDAIRTTIRDGRNAEMPSMGNEYGELELGQIVAYVETLATGAELNDYERHGRDLYREKCVACHGEDGRGQPTIGAADLTDDYWQHGNSMMNKRLVITRGVQSSCPAQGNRLTPAQLDLLTAYVMELAGS